MIQIDYYFYKSKECGFSFIDVLKDILNEEYNNVKDINYDKELNYLKNILN